MLAIVPAIVFSFSVQSGVGLSVQMDGVPIVKGSWWQYYEPGWVKGYYTSQDERQKIENLPDGSVKLTFSSADGLASGTQLYQRNLNGLHVSYDFGWNGDHPILLELTAGMLWAPALQHSVLTSGGVKQRNLEPRSYPPGGDIAAREYGPLATSYAFDGFTGKVGITASSELWDLFDARKNYPQPWAQGDDLLWFGSESVQLLPGKIKHIELDWSFTPAESKPPRVQDLPFKAAPAAVVKEPASPIALVPQPKILKLSPSAGCALSPGVTVRVPHGQEALVKRFRSFLATHWNMPHSASGKVVGEIANLGLPAEGYEIKVSENSAQVAGQDAAGLQNGFYTLALLARPHGERLEIPACSVRDWPTLKWRGIHLFVGPNVSAFHKKLAEKLLLPLKLNKVVLQCERTDWKATPGIQTSITTPRAELLHEFEMLRSYGIEPIPLIQSFGHMEWIFENKQNLDLAINPAIPYTVDPDKPRTKQVLGGIWEETFALLHPKTVHFGLDEVGMRGFPQDPARLTRLWGDLVPWLSDIAAKHGAQAMFWSDVALGPGEATDAESAETVKQAELRRAAFRKGTLIGDWHYVDAGSPSAFQKSLKIWKDAGMSPIATTWFNPQNIHQFAVAAKREGAGLLETTWEGYTSNEPDMMKSLFEGVGYILAADYAWSGREESPDKLDYSPDEFLRRLYIAGPQDVFPLPGESLRSSGSTLSVADVRFREIGPIALRCAVEPDLANGPTELRLLSVPKGRQLAFALDCSVHCAPHEKVAEIRVRCGGKWINRSLFYGDDLRSPSDPAAVKSGARTQGVSLVLVNLPTNAEEVRIVSTNTYAGVRLHGVSAW